MANAGFEKLLSGLEPTLTLFAPDNRAFLRMSKELMKYLSNDSHAEIMAGVGLYHMVHGTFSSSTLKDQMVLSSISGLPLHLYVRQLVENTSIESVNQATIISKDLYAANGVIHIVDSILLPDRFSINVSSDASKNTSVADIIDNCPKLSTFSKVLKNSGLYDLLNDDSKVFTVFAPIDHAWHGAYLKLLDGAHNDQLEEVIKYHIVQNHIHYSIDISDDSHLKTYQGKKIYTTRSTFLSEEMDKLYVDNAEVFKANLVARNGVIHFIDRVLLPES